MGVNRIRQNEAEALEACSSLSEIKTTKGFRDISIVLSLLLLTIVICLIVIPWQQSISGTGKVTVYSAMNRPQNIQSAIAARVKQWHVTEGQHVKKGELLLELTEIDDKYLAPKQLERLEDQLKAYQAKREATLSRIESLNTQIRFLTQSQQAAIPSASVKVSQTQDKILATQQALTNAKQNLVTSELNFTRIEELHKKGLRSTRDFELAQQKMIESQTKVEQAQAYLNVAERDENVAGYDQYKVVADTSAKISSTRASVASAYESLANTDSELNKLEVSVENLVQRINQRNVVAPIDGIVVRITAFGSGETVKKGEILTTLMPKDAELAVELLISDNDAPLVSVGRPVRLQFSGWPAVQFSGWPAVAVGTFAGRVTVVDAIDNGMNRYRVWVEPDKEAIENGDEQPWPSSQYLRPGSKTVGWIMLETVPLWFELWRQFNAFPPTIDIEGMPQHDQHDPKNNIKKRKKK